jgi:hypothetical protein
MKTSYLEHIRPRLENWVKKAPENAKWMSINNSSVHMSVFPLFHENIEEIHQALRNEEADPMTYSLTSIVWDISAEEAIYVWHEIDKLPKSTQEDIDTLREKRDREKAEREEKKLQIREAAEHKARIEEITSERLRSLESEYVEYSVNCFEKGETALPYFLFTKNKIDENIG